MVLNISIKTQTPECSETKEHDGSLELKKIIRMADIGENQILQRVSLHFTLASIYKYRQQVLELMNIKA